MQHLLSLCLYFEITYPPSISENEGKHELVNSNWVELSANRISNGLLSMGLHMTADLKCHHYSDSFVSNT